MTLLYRFLKRRLSEQLSNGWPYILARSDVLNTFFFMPRRRVAIARRDCESFSSGVFYGRVPSLMRRHIHHLPPCRNLGLSGRGEPRHERCALAPRRFGGTSDRANHLSRRSQRQGPDGASLLRAATMATASGRGRSTPWSRTDGPDDVPQLRLPVGSWGDILREVRCEGLRRLIRR
jgi:hypothetical protein